MEDRYRKEKKRKREDQEKKEDRYRKEKKRKKEDRCLPSRPS